MKEFATWVSDMANSVEDESYISRNKLDMMFLTDMQKRLLFADLIVPSQHTSVLISKWLAVASNNEHRQNILGKKEYDEYTACNSLDSRTTWFKGFRRKVLDGWVAPDIQF